MIYLLQKYFPFRHPFPLPCGGLAQYGIHTFSFSFYFFKDLTKINIVGKMSLSFFLFASLKNKICFQINLVDELAIILEDYICGI